VTTESVLLLARNLKNKEDSEMESEHESSGTGSEMTTRTGKKYGYIIRRINPKRKCKTGEFRLSPHYAGGIWKRLRFYSENASNVFRPHYASGI